MKKLELTIVCNKIQCNHCKDIITSYHRHDFKYCICGKISVDGGQDYQHISYDHISDYTNMVVYDTAGFEEIRKVYHRGGRGKDGKQPLTWVPLDKMSDEWIKACIVYNREHGLHKSFASKMYRKELKYRKDNKISIYDDI